MYLTGTIVGKCFLTLGKHSLTIFCIEMAFIVWTKELYQWLFPEYGVNYWTGLLEILVALFGGWLVSILMHKSKFLSRIAYAS